MSKEIPTPQEIDLRLDEEGVKYILLSEVEKLNLYNFILNVAPKFKK